jgi:hypothetical protein
MIGNCSSSHRLAPFNGPLHDTAQEDDLTVVLDLLDPIIFPAGQRWRGQDRHHEQTRSQALC